jgi:septal ring factor EnvC (AmiA/AmiB activator)
MCRLLMLSAGGSALRPASPGPLCCCHALLASCTRQPRPTKPPALTLRACRLPGPCRLAKEHATLQAQAEATSTRQAADIQGLQDQLATAARHMDELERAVADSRAQADSSSESSAQQLASLRAQLEAATKEGRNLHAELSSIQKVGARLQHVFNRCV